MNKTLKTLVHLLCVCSVLAVFSACKSQPEPHPEPQPVQPAEPEVTEEQEHALKLLDELAKVRAQAVEINADTAYPAEFQSADAAAADARNRYEANDFSGAQEKAQRAILQYRTLINRMQIDALKAKIDKHDLSVYDTESYQKAEALDAKIKNRYESDPDEAFKASEEALRFYESVTNSGFASLMADAKKKADEAKERCDSLKSANAMKNMYEKTFMRYRQAGVLAGSQKYEQAYLGYMTAAEEFDAIYEKVKIKREQATNAMERAKARQEASAQLAKDADLEAPLPENAEGFSEEPIEVESLQRPANRRTGGIPAASQRQPAIDPAQLAEPTQPSAPQVEQQTMQEYRTQSAAADQPPQQDNAPAMPAESAAQDGQQPAANPTAGTVVQQPTAESSEGAAPAMMIQPANAAPAAQPAQEAAPASTSMEEQPEPAAASAAPEPENTTPETPAHTSAGQPATGGLE